MATWKEFLNRKPKVIEGTDYPPEIEPPNGYEWITDWARNCRERHTIARMLNPPHTEVKWILDQLMSAPLQAGVNREATIKSVLELVATPSRIYIDKTDWTAVDKRHKKIARKIADLREELATIDVEPIGRKCPIETVVINGQTVGKVTHWERLFPDIERSLAAMQQILERPKPEPTDLQPTKKKADTAERTTKMKLLRREWPRWFKEPLYELQAELICLALEIEPGSITGENVRKA